MTFFSAALLESFFLKTICCCPSSFLFFLKICNYFIVLTLQRCRFFNMDVISIILITFLWLVVIKNIITDHMTVIVILSSFYFSFLLLYYFFLLLLLSFHVFNICSLNYAISLTLMLSLNVCFMPCKLTEGDRHKIYCICLNNCYHYIHSLYMKYYNYRHSCLQDVNKNGSP